jgi:hypothetical protein
METEKKIDLFTYLDYRRYLADQLEELKAREGFSLRQLAAPEFDT